jgi:hypothetical protein
MGHANSRVPGKSTQKEPDAIQDAAMDAISIIAASTK